MTAYEALHPGLKPAMKRVQDLLEAQADSGEAAFDQVLKNWLGHKGKMVRPTLFLIAARVGTPWGERPQGELSDLSGEAFEERLCKHAAAIELIHMATLVHDDVVDEASVRRGQPTIQKTMGKDYAIYMGDYLFCKALTLVADQSVSAKQLKHLSAGMTQVCLGEIRQYHCRFSLEPDLRRYYKIIAGKTAALFALSLYSGALEGGAEEDVAKRLGKIGYNMGMAFQIIDDLLDFSEKDIGKEPLRDLERGHYNLPIQMALFGSNREVTRAALKSLIANQGVGHSHEDLLKALRQSGALEATQKQAQRFTRRALKYSAKLPSGEARETLERLIQDLLVRQL